MNKPYIQFSSCSILPKNNSHARFMVGLKKGEKPKRHVALVFGNFENRKSFNVALLQALRDEDGDIYDLRTVKFHDSFGFPTETSGTVVGLEYLNEDLLS